MSVMKLNPYWLNDVQETLKLLLVEAASGGEYLSPGILGPS